MREGGASVGQLNGEPEGLKERIERLEQQVAELKSAASDSRSGWASFIIGFVVVLALLLVVIGIIQFII